MNSQRDFDRRDASTFVRSLTGPYAYGLIGVPVGELLVSWTVESSRSGAAQQAYEIQSAYDANFENFTSTGVVSSADSIAVPSSGGPLASREVRHFRVRIETGAGWTAWSESLSVEAGLSSPKDWSAIAVGIPSSVGGPSPLLRREFVLPSRPASARLRITSLGLNRVELNGAVVGDHVLTPGWTSYNHRLTVSTHDVTSHLVEGANAIAITLADGWYRGRLGWEGRDSIYGNDLAALAQLEVSYENGDTQIIPTDAAWRGSFGEVRASGIYDGADIDLQLTHEGWSNPGFDDTDWIAVHEVPLDLETLEPLGAPPVREIAQFELHRVESSPGLVFDARQNVAGWVRLVVNGLSGQSVTVRHAEVLDPDGTLHTRSLRTARATDTYVLAHDGLNTLEPVFTFHGFRFVSIESHATVVTATAIAISSDTPVRSTFECAVPALNQLHSNVVWSQRDNFVSVPTDCPQRDERLGWTGDAQAFAATANTLFDTSAFWESWLADLEADQAPDGGVASVVPNILGPDAFPINGVGQNLFGRAGWADAATIVPWSLYQAFGTTEPLRRQLRSMRKWVDHLDNRRNGHPLLPTEFQFGDWLDPDAPGHEPWSAKVAADFVANAFFARSASILAQTELLVGSPERAAKYQVLARDVAEATWSTFGDHAVSTQTGCALALEFDIAPIEARHAVAEALAANVRDERGRIATGFLGTPLVLHALSATRHIDEAYLMLLRRDVPSWLYQVDMGATTVWERWDALSPDGSIHPGDMANHEDAQMLSFNHYAYGAVVDWIYQTVAGIAIDPDNPGYRTVLVAPRPTASIPWAKAVIASPYGPVSIDWQLSAIGDLEIELTIPFGSRAKLDLPIGPGSTISTPTTLLHGTHSIVVTSPAVARE